MDEHKITGNHIDDIIDAKKKAGEILEQRDNRCPLPCPQCQWVRREYAHEAIRDEECRKRLESGCSTEYTKASEEWLKDYQLYSVPPCCIKVIGYDKDGNIYNARAENPKEVISFLLAAKDKEIEEMKDEFARTLNSGKKMYELGKRDGAREVKMRFLDEAGYFNNQFVTDQLNEDYKDFLNLLKADTPEEKV